jgi:LmbE family N-acetylglucosaminyl deacetylase
MDRLSLLAVFAHPVDESCGPGATLAMYAHRGVEVSLICVTRGEQGICDDPNCEAYQPIPRSEAGLIRVRELAGACKTLGISRWEVLGYADGGGTEWDRRAMEAEMVKWIRTLRPQVVVTCYPEGAVGHPDHDTVARVTTRAYLGAGHARRFPEQFGEGLIPWQPVKLYYAIPQDPELAIRCKGQRPLTVVDVSAFVEVKIRAMQCHSSQKQCSQGLVEEVRHNARWMEAFYLAHSRLMLPESPEEDLFGLAGEVETRRLMR